MWILLAIVVVAAFVMSAMAPKQEAPSPQDVDSPVSEEGTSIRKIYGTVWIKDPMIVAFEKVGQDRIRSKGGKK